MAQVLCIRSIKSLVVLKFQTLSRLLHKIHQFVDLQKCHKRVHDRREITAHQNEQRGPPDSQIWDFLRMNHFFGRRRSFGFIEENLHISQILKGLYNSGPDIRPGQAAKEYLGILELAAKEGEARVERILRQRSADGLLIRAEELERALREETLVATASDVCIMGMNLGDYDELLSQEATTCLATLH